MSKIASLDVDCQKTFTPICPNELPIPNGDDIVDELNRQAKLADYRVGSKDAHHPNAIWVANNSNPVLSKIIGKNVDLRWPKHALVGTQGFELLDGLPHPSAYDYFVWKGIELDMHPYGVCFHDHAERSSTGLIEFLKDRRVTTIIVGGLAFDYCVRVSVQQLRQAGFNIIVNLAATRSLDNEGYQTTFASLKSDGVQFAENTEALSIHLGK